MAVCENMGTEKQKNEFLKIVEECKGNPNELISALQKTQGVYGYLPEFAIKKISDELLVPLSEVYGVITFYSFFTLTPKAKYNVNICLGTACFVAGGDKVLEEATKKLGIEPGKLSEDGKWLITTCRCIGCCGLAPAVTINGKVYGKVTPSQMSKILEEYK